MKILIASDAWHPQVNGVVRTLSKVSAELNALGHEIRMVTPDQFRTIPAPSYPEIRLAIWPHRGVRRAIESFQPDAIHVATEGPLGWAVRRHCLRRGWPYTTSYTTRFPEYLHARWRVPLSASYAVLRAFHNRGAGTMVATETMREALRGRGFDQIVPWTRGVDTDTFKPIAEPVLAYPRPIWLYAGRVALEKNIEAFLDLPLEGTKVVVGQGPQLESLRAKYSGVVFTGYRVNGELARTYASADVFVFPSRTDTFGLVMLEALASGVPVAAFPVPGPLDVIGATGTGVLDEDLHGACQRALLIPREHCRRHALQYSWRRCAEKFVENLVPIGGLMEVNAQCAPALSTWAESPRRPDAPG
jgi:glycosyltransferase involved in cell wall biosynthesis